MSNNTRIELDAGTGAVIETTLGNFLRDNADAVECGEIDRLDLIECLRECGEYSGGGGASPAWTIRLRDSI